jgi:hypothetical protein
MHACIHAYTPNNGQAQKGKDEIYTLLMDALEAQSRARQLGGGQGTEGDGRKGGQGCDAERDRGVCSKAGLSKEGQHGSGDGGVAAASTQEREAQAGIGEQVDTTSSSRRAEQGQTSALNFIL